MKKTICLLMAGIGLSVLLFTGCKKTAIREATTTDVNIYDYLVSDPQGRFTELVKAVNKAEYQAFLNAYGTYTMFAPTNEAIAKYLTKVGKGSIEQLQPDEIKDLL